MALMGFPFLTGFYSKDVILEVAYAKYNFGGHWAHGLGSIAAFFTAFYSVRLLHLTFLAVPAGHKAIMEKAHEPSWAMIVPLWIS
jgi:NADH-ubiquinone oxidoreductase chain 5